MVLVMQQQRRSMSSRADVTASVDLDQSADRCEQLNRRNDDAHAAYEATLRHAPTAEAE